MHINISSSIDGNSPEFIKESLGGRFRRNFSTFSFREYLVNIMIRRTIVSPMLANRKAFPVSVLSFLSFVVFVSPSLSVSVSSS